MTLDPTTSPAPLGDPFTSVLIGRLSAIGDIVFALPVLASLRAARPELRIGWLVEDRCADLLRGHPWIDEILVYPRGGLQSWTRHPMAALKVARAYRRELGARSYDVALELQGNLKCAVQLACLPGARRIGFERAALREPWSAWLTRDRARVPAGRIHRIEKMLAILAPLGIPALRAFPPPPPPDAAEEARAVAALAPAGDRPIVAIHPFVSSYGRDKEWPAERFVALARALRREFDAWCYLIRSPKEDEPASALVRAADGAIVDAVPRGSLRDLMACLPRVRLFIGSDSGPLHVAGWLDRPILGLYGPTDPAVYGPVRDHARVVCAGPQPPPRRHRTEVSPAMLDLAVEPVLAAARELLAAPPPLSRSAP